MVQEKKKAVFFVIIAVVVITYFLVSYLQRKGDDYSARKECFKLAQGGSLPASGKQIAGLTENLDCTPYKQELDAAFPSFN